MKLQLDAVSFAPHELDGSIQARMHLGSQEIVTTWPKSQDIGIARLVDQLAVRVVDVALARTDAGREIQTLCHERKLALCVFPWRAEMGSAGLRRNAVYLVRPDGYVALADRDGGAMAVTAYLDARKFK